MHDAALVGDREPLAEGAKRLRLPAAADGEGCARELTHEIEQPVLEAAGDLERSRELTVGGGFAAARLQYLGERKSAHHLEERRAELGGGAHRGLQLLERDVELTAQHRVPRFRVGLHEEIEAALGGSARLDGLEPMRGILEIGFAECAAERIDEERVVPD